MVSDPLNAAPDGVLVVDVDGQIRFANRTVERIFGHAAGTLVGQSLECLVPGALGAARDHQEGLMGQRVDGSALPVNVTLTPISTDTGQHTIVALRPSGGRRGV